MGKKYKQIKQLPLDTRVIIDDDSWDTFLDEIVGDEKTFITWGKTTVYGQFPNKEWGRAMSVKFATERGYKVISFEDFLKDYCKKIKYAYHAQTEEEAEWFCKDKPWFGNDGSGETNWTVYLNDTCYSIEFDGKLTYCDRTYYINNGYEIIEISEMSEYIEWKKNQNRKPKFNPAYSSLIIGITKNNQIDVIDIINSLNSMESDLIEVTKRSEVKEKYVKLHAFTLWGTSIELDKDGEVVCEDGEE